jgi:DNA repair photolyase
MENVRETLAKAILSASKIYDYALNPYTGCEHACSYCYARFMRRFSGHREPWGEFVDVKVNAADLLEAEIRRKSGMSSPADAWRSWSRKDGRCGCRPVRRW